MFAPTLTQQQAKDFVKRLPWPHIHTPHVALYHVGEADIDGVRFPLFSCYLAGPECAIQMRHPSAEGALRAAIEYILNELERQAGGACSCIENARYATRKLSN